MLRRISRTLITASVMALASIFILGGCAPNHENKAKTHTTPKYQGVILPINEPVNIRHGPFPKSTTSQKSHFNNWTNGKLEVEDKVVTGVVEAQRTSNGIVMTMNMMFAENSPNVLFVAHFNNDREFLKIDKFLVAGKDIALANPNAWSIIKKVIEDFSKSFFLGYKRSGIVVGGTIYDGVIEILDVRMSSKVVALGLSNYGGRKALVTSSTGKISSNHIDGHFSGYSLIDLETGMVSLREDYISFQTENVKTEGNVVQEINLPPKIFEPKGIEGSGPDERLQKIKELLDKGFITENEAKAKRAEILKDL